MSLRTAHSNMVEQQVRPWDVLDQRVLDVLSEVPRQAFLAPAHHGVAFSDYELPIGHGQHMLKPVVDGRFLQSLQLSETDHVLEIGTGSGYLTACLARLARHCTSLELLPALSAEAGERLSAQGVSNVTLHVQDAAQPWEAEPTYDAIVLSGSVPAVPDFYRERLAIGGRLVLVVGTLSQPTMEAQLLRRIGQEEWATESLFETRIAPLEHFQAAPTPFVF